MDIQFLLHGIKQLPTSNLLDNINLTLGHDGT